jgi:hypothetical protein
VRVLVAWERRRTAMGNRRLWKQKDGTKIRIKDMSDQHLLNTIKYLERKADEFARSVPYPQFNDLFTRHAEQAWNSLQDNPTDYMLAGTIYDDLCEEYIRRGMTA